jgi:hypothetical protein
MPNTFQNQVAYTNETLRCLMNEIILGKKVARDQEGKFAKSPGKIGDTFNIRRPARFTVSTGAAFAAQDYIETSIPIVVNNQKHVDVSFTSADLTLKDEDYSARKIKPGAIQLGQQIDIDGYINAKNTVGPLTGTAGTSPNNISFLTDLGRKMDDYSVPRSKRYLAMDQIANASMINALSGFFQAAKSIASQYKDGVFVDMENTVGFLIGMSQNIARHTVGPLGGAPAVNGAAQGLTAGWANTGTLITNAWTAAAAQRVAAGDNFTIANHFAVNPVTKQSTGQLMQYTCTAAQSSDGAGNLTLTITPAIITAGPWQNVVASPGNGSLLTFSGTASTTYGRSIAWVEDAFSLACVPLEDLAQFGGWGASKSQDGFALRVFRQAAISTDTVGGRVDTLYGWATPYPEQACQLVGA